MPDAFDIGPLTWVHDEIKLALKEVASHLDVYEKDHENVSALKHALTHLNQVSGALDMVGLEGCKRFCIEIETFVSALGKQVIVTTSEALQLAKQSIIQLEHYLQDLLNGEPDQSLRLFGSLAKLAALRGEVLEPSVLFFPDLNQSAPKETSMLINLVDEGAAAFFSTQRNIFQRALLSWLKTAVVEDLNGMRGALEHIYATQQQSSQRTFWWVAIAFLDVLSLDSIARQPQVKKIFRRIDQQLRSVESGNGRVNQALMKDMLYFIALAEASSPALEQVKAVFNLNHLIPNAQSKNRKHSQSEEVFADEKLASKVIAPMLRELEAMKSSWTLVSEGVLGAFATFLSQTELLLNHADGLRHQAIIKVVVALNVFAQVWDESGLVPTEEGLEEVAAGLALLESALNDYQHINQDVQQRLMTQAQRIKNISDGVMGDDASLSNTQHDLAEDALVAMAWQIKEGLHSCEQILDSFFRNPTQLEVLTQVDEPIKQLIAAFDILNMPVPMELLNVSQHIIHKFAMKSATSSQLERLADSLSLLGLFVTELPHVSNIRLQALEASLVSLNEALQKFSEEDDKPLANQANMLNLEEVKSGVTVDVEIRNIFLQEAEEVLASVAESIKALRINITASNSLTNLRRGFHTLKGSGRMVGFGSD